MGAQKHRRKKHAAGFPIWGMVLLVISLVALGFVINGLQLFFNMRAGMDNSDTAGELFSGILLFSTLGIYQLAIAIISLFVMLITLPLAIYYLKEGK